MHVAPKSPQWTFLILVAGLGLAFTLSLGACSKKKSADGEDDLQPLSEQQKVSMLKVTAPVAAVREALTAMNNPGSDGSVSESARALVDELEAQCAVDLPKSTNSSDFMFDQSMTISSDTTHPKCPAVIILRVKSDAAERMSGELSLALNPGVSAATSPETVKALGALRSLSLSGHALAENQSSHSIVAALHVSEEWSGNADVAHHNGQIQRVPTQYNRVLQAQGGSGTNAKTEITRSMRMDFGSFHGLHEVKESYDGQKLSDQAVSFNGKAVNQDELSNIEKKAATTDAW